MSLKFVNSRNEIKLSRDICVYIVNISKYTKSPPKEFKLEHSWSLDAIVQTTQVIGINNGADKFGNELIDKYSDF